MLLDDEAEELYEIIITQGKLRELNKRYEDLLEDYMGNY